MTKQPEADEMTVRTRLRVLLGEAPVIPSSDAPARDPDDWWDRLYADEQPHPEPARNWWQAKPKPEPADEEPDDEDQLEDDEQEAASRKRAPRKARPRSRRQSLLGAYDAIPSRLRWLIYHGTAAAAGWRLGIVQWATNTAAWYAHGHWIHPTAWVLYGLGACAVALYRRTRTWIWPIAWAAAIPASSIVVGALLYGTTS